jgi:GNAT superfamily N-acetyltransferase
MAPDVEIPDVEIRRAVPADRERVLPLARHMATSFAVDAGTFASTFPALLGRDDAIVLVASASGGLVGYLVGFDHLAFYANGRVSYVEEVAVSDDRQGEGVGRRLMQGFEAWARERSSTLVTVATRRAAPFYRALGYEETATLFRKVF